jgi:ribosome-associated heat shock protein Hsp15
METAGKIRLDKWLWFARVVKTRALAQELAGSGHVRVNGQRAAAAAKTVRIGDVLTIALPSRVRVLKVRDVAERRGPAAETTHLYEELSGGP